MKYWLLWFKLKPAFADFYILIESKFEPTNDKIHDHLLDISDDHPDLIRRIWAAHQIEKVMTIIKINELSDLLEYFS